VALLIVICVGVPFLALAVQGSYFKRTALIAVGLEAAKYFFFFTINPVPRSEFSSFILVILFYITMLPELFIGNEPAPSTFWQWVARLSVGIVWNLAPAYLIVLWLSHKPSPQSIETAH